MSSILCLTILVRPRSREPIANKKEYSLIRFLASCCCFWVHLEVPSASLTNSYNFSNCSSPRGVLSSSGFSSLIVPCRRGSLTDPLHTPPSMGLLCNSSTIEVPFIGIFVFFSKFLGGTCAFTSSGANICGTILAAFIVAILAP